jgi:hypothetical protein
MPLTPEEQLKEDRELFDVLSRALVSTLAGDIVYSSVFKEIDFDKFYSILQQARDKARIDESLAIRKLITNHLRSINQPQLAQVLCGKIQVMHGPLEQRQIEFLAKVEGWTHIESGVNGVGEIMMIGINQNCFPNFRKHLLPNYLHSRDALQPVLEKLTDDQWYGLSKFLYNKYPFAMSVAMAKHLILMPPNQLANALCEVLGFEE